MGCISSEPLEAFSIDGSLVTRTGRNEFSTTKEEPKQVTPMITKIDPRINNGGAMKTNSILVTDPIKPNARRRDLRFFSVMHPVNDSARDAAVNTSAKHTVVR
jgi:hypothetical protein